ncbi:RsmF rRNA methyltransferase first C-terminal domain-containing protein [Lacticaseibacillus mingshuiensis]|uniref:RsmF rRNA methyltransferase first C-terminal domain-containing protein n=1 Tax=Lacticaseibacillus mingshuiensis TaxID=2799574 RepID=A0ABW4CGR2_9LACO|nr:RsmF rRNA methyltransferase first C-terminal domain-containing protein [Lacticaseibacillus mingshuiensis]
MTFPDGFEEKYRALLGTEADAFFASFAHPAQSGFRVSPLRPPLAMNEHGPAIPWSPTGEYGKVDGNGIDHVSGYVYSQEPSAQFVAAVCAATPGQRVLDLCAAPGGKTTQLAGQLQGEGLLVANEINAGRAKILASNLERFGVQNAVVTNNAPAELAAELPASFDLILVDAPCSGEGMFRKDPDAMQYWSPDLVAQCATRQREIVAEAVKMLRPGGTLVYSTCTFAPEEDEQLAVWAVQTLPLTLQPIAKVGGIQDGRPAFAGGDDAVLETARLWPHELAGEGHFVAKFIKDGDEPAQPGKRMGASKLTAPQQQDLRAGLTALTDATWPQSRLVLRRDQLFAMPEAAPQLAGLHVVRPGLHLGTFKTHRFEPSHSLATALPPASFHQVIEVAAADYARYRHGETLTVPTSGRGWVLLTHQGKGFALGKQVDHVIKNAYPKGLRV